MYMVLGVGDLLLFFVAQSPRNFYLVFLTQFLGSLEAQRRARHAHGTIHSSNAMSGKKARARKQKHERRDANAADAGEAIPGLPDNVVTHVLRSEHFDDPADLARLRAVSRAMRDAVAATGLRFEELDEYRAVTLGCLSALRLRQRGGRLSRQGYLCVAAARSGHLEVLQWLRTNGCPWDSYTCMRAAQGGHLEVLQWARTNGCPWDELACMFAALGGHLEALQWSRANGCPWDGRTIDLARANGYHDVVIWAKANGSQWTDGST